MHFPPHPWIRNLFLALAVSQAASAGQGTCFDLIRTGPVETRMNLVILAEGYIAGQEDQFRADAAALLDQFFAVEPFLEYRAYFNVRGLFVASAQAGSDHPRSGIFRDTYFNSSFDSFGIDQVLTIPPNDRDPDPAHGRDRVQALVAAHAPENQLVIVLVNDPEYGGSGGPILIGSLNMAAAELLLHEAGHSLGGLADEYADPYPIDPVEMPNATAQTRRDRIPWAAWIAADTPLPTPATPEYAGVIGLFEGAQYQAQGWFRPRLECKMRALGVPFCEVCREQLLRVFYRRARPIESVLPETNRLEVAGNERIRFEVRVPAPRSHSIRIEWDLDGKPMSIDPVWFLDPRTLANGSHAVHVRASDATDWVRTDPEGRLEATAAWTLNVERPDLRLEMSLVSGSDAARVEVAGFAPRGFALERSADFQEWTPILTNGLTDGRFQAELPVNRPGAFYRAVSR
ncbi:MAG TPA: M64 family metallopeptidase [Candidatus Paceibacterota bacterium]|nr:hypothetical protein [Verrucomicrobiota bacterium]HOX04708.1 M64 family metallopeptidase [Verrucomicrobiota bacterium]HRZ47559.1 M64 family metallopeptidase [Candidatus Paceibacterota bacterium]